MASFKEWKRDWRKLPKWAKASIVIGIIGVMFTIYFGISTFNVAEVVQESIKEYKECQIKSDEFFKSEFSERYGGYGLTSPVMLEADLLSGKYIPTEEAFGKTSEEERKNAEDYFNDAKEQMIKENYEEALRLLDESIKLNPYSNAWNEKGLTLYYLNRYDEAIKSFETMIGFSPNNRDALYNLAAVYKNYKKEYEVALCISSLLLGIYPNDGEVLANHGVILASLDRHEEAIESFTKALPLIEDNKDLRTKTFYDRGLSYFKVGNYEKARTDFKASFKLEEDYNTLFYIGASEGYLGNYLATAEIFDELLNKYESQLTEDKLFDVYYNVGVVYLNNLGDDNKGYFYLKKASIIKEEKENLVKEDYLVFHWLGMSSFKLEKYEEAVYYLNKSVELNPEDVAGWQTMGFSYRYLNQPQKTLEAFDNALKIKPNDESLLFEKAQDLYYLGRTEECTEIINKILSINPNYTYALQIKEEGLC